MQIPRKLKRLCVGVIGATALATLPVMGLAEAGSEQAENPEARLPLEDLRTFAKVFEQIRRGYVNEIDDRTLLEHAIRGMLQGLDPHSAYLDSSSFSDLQENTTGEFTGLGVEIAVGRGHITVVTPMDGTPAARAGLQAGDVILRLAGESMRGATLDKAIKNMRGPVGTSVNMTIAREGIEQPFEVTVRRDRVRVPSVRAQMLEPGFGYVRIGQFQMETGPDVIKSVTDLQQRNDLKGLVLDLRNNPGGVLQASVDVVDAFLEKGLVVYTEGRDDTSEFSASAQPGDIINGVPIVVLINEGSASASEIVAGALQDHRRAVVMGTDSFGKGSVQTVIPISNERAIKLTTALYYTPSGRSIQAQGITPDIVVERAKVETLQARRRTTEADLAGHLANGNGGAENNAAAREEASDDGVEAWQSRDNQVFEALSLLKGLQILSANSVQNSAAGSVGTDKAAVLDR
ncbi:S41 family peptidase [Biformimicrobium ophioploci]|uniref:Proteolytic complex protein CptA n=1 Tax=Biformimicrobium ophioploci TaxID=3036711 RepID=A0ABQ6LW07_9GAMM|nr:S41 family peptidase [Microbulbifer sp. NKW57]GMG86251.1 proteolytic complex protein CptA [Microbulbifer sp. NKW57]